MTGAPRGAGRLTIARIWGIPISLHASWLLVFALLVGSLAGGYLPGRKRIMRVRAELGV